MQTLDPFAMFGLPRRYEVDLGEVERLYLERSAALHPDMLGEAGFAELGGDGGEVGGVGDQLAELNAARHTLEDPEQRTITLWKLCGGVDDKALPPGLLMEMMEVREEIEALQARKDPAGVAKWEEWADQQRETYRARVADLFSRLSPRAESNPGVLKLIKLELNAWRYIERLAEQLHEA